MLTQRKRNFIAEYQRDWNATQAAIRAGYAPKNARQSASVLLSDPDITDELAKAVQGRLTRLNVTADNVLAIAMSLAATQLRDVVEWDDENGVRLRNPEDIPDHAHYALVSVKEKRRHEVSGRGKDKEVWEIMEREVKIADKGPALNLLAKYLKLLNDAPQTNTLNLYANTSQTDIASLLAALGKAPAGTLLAEVADALPDPPEEEPAT